MLPSKAAHGGTAGTHGQEQKLGWALSSPQTLGNSSLFDISPNAKKFTTNKKAGPHATPAHWLGTGTTS